jgi:hypothetical protein
MCRAVETLDAQASHIGQNGKVNISDNLILYLTINPDDIELRISDRSDEDESLRGGEEPSDIQEGMLGITSPFDSELDT